MNTATQSTRGTRRRPAPVCGLLDSGRGALVAQLVTRVVSLVATYSDTGHALVFVTPDGDLYIEPATSREANWLRANAPGAAVGTYTASIAAGDIEDDLCARLAEINPSFASATA